jgi:hypothetical protein
MECMETAYLAEKYEFGELSGYKKKKFEHHLKECKKCYSKYGTLLLLGAVIGSSVKSAEYSTRGGSLSLFFKRKTAIVITALGVVGFAGVVALKEEKVKEKPIKEEIIVSFENENIGTLTGKEIIEDSSYKSKKLRIISKSEEKEIEITVDKKSLKMNNRFEK